MQKFLIYPVTVSAISLPFLSYTVFVNIYKKYRARYDFDDNEIPVRKDIQRRFQEVINDLNLRKEVRERIKLFNVHDINTYHAGTVFTQYGGIIGVPVNFEYKDIENITEDTISIRTIQVDWNTKAAKQFLNSLILSENAQKFALARELLIVTSYKPLMKGFNFILDAVIISTIYFLFSNKLQSIRNKIRRYLYASAAIVICSAVILYCNYNINRNDELQINDRLTELGDKYVEGGVEYYEQLLKRNKALKVLFGTMSKYYITSTGDEVPWFIDGKIKFSKQLEYFKTKMEN
ncbi:hypothetical protein WN48_10522, partial [Eufriesea mexicana]